MSENTISKSSARRRSTSSATQNSASSGASSGSRRSHKYSRAERILFKTKLPTPPLTGLKPRHQPYQLIKSISTGSIKPEIPGHSVGGSLKSQVRNEEEEEEEEEEEDGFDSYSMASRDRPLSLVFPVTPTGTHFDMNKRNINSNSNSSPKPGRIGHRNNLDQSASSSSRGFNIDDSIDPSLLLNLKDDYHIHDLKSRAMRLASVDAVRNFSGQYHNQSLSSLTQVYRSQSKGDKNRKNSVNVVRPSTGDKRPTTSQSSSGNSDFNRSLKSANGYNKQQNDNLLSSSTSINGFQLYDHLRNSNQSSHSLHHPLQRQQFQQSQSKSQFRSRVQSTSRSEDNSHQNYGPEYSPSKNTSASRVTTTTFNFRDNNPLSTWAPVPAIPTETSESNPQNLPDWRSLRDYPERLTSNPISSIREDFDYSLRKLITEKVFEEILDDQLARYRFRDWLLKNQMSAAVSKVDLWLDSRTFTRLIEFIKRGATGIHDIYLNPHSSGFIKTNEQTRDEIFIGLQQIVNIQTEEVFRDVEKDLLRSLFNNEFQSFLKHLVVSQVHVRLGKFNLSEVDKDGLGDCFCLTNPRMRDHPIVLVSEGFNKVTGYDRKEIVGRSCRFLQGPETAPQSVQRIRDGLNSGEGCTELLLNYRRDGTPFYCLLCIIPLRDASGSLVYFIGGQINVTGMFSSKKGLSFLFGEPESDSANSGHGKAEKDNGLEGLRKGGQFQLSPLMQKYSKGEGGSSIDGRSSVNGDLANLRDTSAAGSISANNDKKEMTGGNDSNNSSKVYGFDSDAISQRGTGGSGFLRKLFTGKTANYKKLGLKFGMTDLKTEQRLAGAEAQIGGAKPLEEQLRIFETTYSKIIIFKRETREIIFATRQVLRFLGLPDSTPKEIYKSNLIQKDFLSFIWSNSVMTEDYDSGNGSTNEIREYVKKTIKAGLTLSLDCQVKAIERSHFFGNRREKFSKMKSAKIHLTPLTEREGQVVAYVCIVG